MKKNISSFFNDPKGPFDLHMHTAFCDGENTPEDMVKAAIEKGLSAVGLSGHSYTFFDESYCMSEADTVRYIKEANSLKEKYADQIAVFLGIEQDLCSAAKTDAFDYVIGSVHYLKCGERYIGVDESPDQLKALCEAYYASVATLVESTGCDIIGHFDLITKFNDPLAEKNGGERLFDESHPRYRAAWKQAADALLKHDVCFEINTGAISRGWKTSPYPSAEILSYLKARGAKLILSSDAHSTDAVAFEFDTYRSLLDD